MNDSNRYQRYLYLPIVIVVLLLGYGVYRKARAEMNLRKVRQLQQAQRNLPPEQRRESMQQFRAALDKLTPNQRQQLREEGRKRFEQQMLDFVKLSPAEKSRRLDEQIDRMEQWRQRAGNGNTFGAGPTRNSNRPLADQDRRRRDRLDGSTPEFRAAMDQYRKDMEARRRQRGLPPGRG